MQRPITRSPAAKPAVAAATSPAHSMPAGLPFGSYAPWPPRSSPRLNDVARTLTSSWPCLGSGVGTSRGSSANPRSDCTTQYDLIAAPAAKNESDDTARSVRFSRAELEAVGSIPFALDAVAARSVAVQRCDEAEQATVCAVSKLVTTYLHEVTGTDVLAADTVPINAGRRRRFERPDRRVALVAFDVEVDDRVRRDHDDLLDRPFDDDPFRDVVVRVRVVSERRSARNEQGRKQFPQHDATPSAADEAVA